MNITKSDKDGIIGSGGNFEDEIIKISFFKNSITAIRYLTPKARLVFT